MTEDQPKLAVALPAASKKAYRIPEFVIYGDVRHMTQAVGVTGAMDGGGPVNMNKSSP